MMRIDRDEHLAKAYSRGDAQFDHRRTARCGRRLPYQEQIWLKKIAQRKKRSKESEVSKTLRVATLDVGSMTGRSLEIVEIMERRNINILCVQETTLKGA